MEEALKERLLALWQGKKTSYQIAAELGVSRNAVLGVIKRHKDKGVTLRGRLPVEKKAKIQKPKPVERLLDYAEPVVGVTLMELRHNSCRFIVAEDEAPIYCGRTRTRGPYCAEHYAVCYVPVRKAMARKIEAAARHS